FHDLVVPEVGEAAVQVRGVRPPLGGVADSLDGHTARGHLGQVARVRGDGRKASDLVARGLVRGQGRTLTDEGHELTVVRGALVHLTEPRGRGGNLAHAVAVVVAVVVRDRGESCVQVAALLVVVRDALKSLRGREVLLLVALVRLGGGQERLQERRDARGLIGGGELLAL